VWVHVAQPEIVLAISMVNAVIVNELIRLFPFVVSATGCWLGRGRSQLELIGSRYDRPWSVFFPDGLKGKPEKRTASLDPGVSI
jgi:hypothetical protein